MAKEPDYYKLLNVARTASRAEIRRAYRRRARELHPDVNPSPDATQQMQELNRVYQVLNDPVRRAVYDRTGMDPRTRRGPAQSPPPPPNRPPPPRRTDPPPRRGYTPPPPPPRYRTAPPPQRRTGPPPPRPYEPGGPQSVRGLILILAELLVSSLCICDGMTSSEEVGPYVGLIMATVLLISFGIYACPPFKPLPMEPARSLGLWVVAWSVVCIIVVEIAAPHPSAIVNGVAIAVGLAGVGFFVAHGFQALRTRKVA